MFETVKLLTRDGGFVHEADIPRFNPPAEVLVWGERVFVRQENGEYREGMAYPIIDFNDARNAVRPIIEREAAAEQIGPDTMGFTMRGEN